MYQCETGCGEWLLDHALRRSMMCALMAVAMSGCGAAPGQVQAADRKPSSTATVGSNMEIDETGVSRQFRSLDEYLLHLQAMQGPVDGPWYKEIRPGVYELQTGNLQLDEDTIKRIYTREELERKFGFRK